MQRFILTGAPGAGKTVILRQLECDGYAVVEEAATDVIALQAARGVDEPHLDPAFIDTIVALQRLRRTRAARETGAVQVHDRSAICTLALARHLGFPVRAALAAELQAIEAEAAYQRRVLFIETLGFVTPTQARRISLDDALRFAETHRRTYAERGYDLVSIAAGPLDERLRAVKAVIGHSR